jgi:hypothetical protein
LEAVPVYSYLTFSLVLSVIGLLLVLSARGQKRKFIYLSGLFAAPTGLADVWFAPEYWLPDYLIGPHFSIEGVLFSFGNGALLAFLIWPVAGRFLAAHPLTPRHVDYWKRGFWAMLPGLLVFFVLWDGLAGSLPVMQASFAGFVALGLWFALRGQLNLLVGLAGVVIFSFAYWVQTVIWALFDPELSRFWSGEDYLSAPLPLTGLPVDELLWAAFYGLLWPHIIALSLSNQGLTVAVRNRRAKSPALQIRTPSADTIVLPPR